MIALAVLSIVIYASCGAWLFAKWQDHEKSALINVASAVAIVCQSIFIAQTAISDNGFKLGFFTASNIIAVWLVALGLLFSIFKPVQKLMAPFLMLAAINVTALLSASDNSTAIPSAVAAHVIPSLLAYAALSFTAAYAALLWFQNNALRTQQLSKLITTLPSLDILESLLIWMVAIGAGLLTLSIVSGVIFIDDFFAQRLVHKTFFTLLAWLTFVALLTGHFAFHWRGTQAVKWTFWGYGFLVTGYFGSKFVIEYLLA